ncbi:MAG: tRNA-dihydrouridine synthase, partial [Motiliproteus sp.]|nr:tRNA-dihydrouridine synthase [Motiliproteus sp.]
MRNLLTDLGGLDRCVTEFVRVSERELPKRVFYRLAPELNQGGLTDAGTPVYVQLLGSEPEVMAANALRAAALGAPGIDLNFGCPAKTVNRNRGGSILLKDPDEVYRIVEAVRQAVPQSIPVTAKMRLGYEDKGLAVANAQAIATAGANELCVHARTKVEGYRPPAHWHWIDKIRQSVTINVIANGDICSPDDYQRCREISGCTDIMIGRGLLQQPDLAAVIVKNRQGQIAAELEWKPILAAVQKYCHQVQQQVAAKHAPGRVKQWLAFLRKRYPEAQLLFDVIKTETNLDAIHQQLKGNSPISAPL